MKGEALQCPCRHLGTLLGMDQAPYLHLHELNRGWGSLEHGTRAQSQPFARRRRASSESLLPQEPKRKQAGARSQSHRRFPRTPGTSGAPLCLTLLSLCAWRSARGAAPSSGVGESWELGEEETLGNTRSGDWGWGAHCP